MKVIVGALNHSSAGNANAVGLTSISAGMRREPSRWHCVPLFAFIVALGLTAVVLASNGTNGEGIRRALRLTARFSFLLFWCAYASGSLAALWGSRFRAMARYGREFGLAFASAHSIHLGLVIWLYQISAAPPLSDAMATFFSVGLLWTYLLALFSIQRLSGMLGAKLWRGMRLVGLEYIMLAFQADFVPGSLHADPKHLITYVPFAALGLAGTGMRIVSWMKKMRQPSQTAIGTDSLRQTHGA